MSTKLEEFEIFSICRGQTRENYCSGVQVVCPPRPLGASDPPRGRVSGEEADAEYARSSPDDVEQK